MKTITAILFSVISIAPCFAADIDNGEDLHFEHCTGCHGSEVYSRDDRNMKDLAQLGKQV